MKNILAINGSYRKGGITDQTVEAFARAVHDTGAEVEIVLLREYPIEFCLNCRACTQEAGEKPAACVLQDGMAGLIERIERADGYILASPTNFFTVTALFKRFLERLVVYAYWPWEMKGPRYRKSGVARKKAILASSCAAPGVLGRYLYGTRRQLGLAAKTIGADPVGTIFTGMISTQSEPVLPERSRKRIIRLVDKLLAP